MSHPDKQQRFNSDITYRVGRKSGRITVPEVSGSASGSVAVKQASFPVSSQAGTIYAIPSGSNKLLQLIWMKAPYPSLKWSALAVILMPAVVFAAILWLLDKLSQP